MEPTAETKTMTCLAGADGLRAIAAVMVFVHHASFLTFAMYNSAAGGIFARLDYGVAIFFALSAFLLGRPYVGAILDGEPLPEVGSYYRRRILRIVPAYWVALTLTYVWLRPESATEAEGIDFPLHYLLLQIYPGDTFPKGISPAWTLAVEASFYALLPLLALGGARLVRGLAGPSRRALALLGAIGVLAVLSLVWRSVVYGRGGPYQAALWLPGTFCEFALGLAAAVLVMWAARREAPRVVTGALGRHDLLWWALAAGLIAFSASQIGLERGLDHANWSRELFGELTRLGVAGLMLLPVAFGPPDRGVIRRMLRSWPVGPLGVASYGFFLWHVPLIEVALRWTDHEMFLAGEWETGIGILSSAVWWPVLVAFLLSVVAGALSWFLIEKPIIRSHRYKGSTVRRSEPPIVVQAAP
jgi:peptidoglycan/LPS O-acetylase OafA/YrhL